MGRDKYMGMDVHQATTVVAVIDAEGKSVLETIVPTAAGAIRRLIESISGPLHVTRFNRIDVSYRGLQDGRADIKCPSYHR